MYLMPPPPAWPPMKTTDASITQRLPKAPTGSVESTIAEASTGSVESTIAEAFTAPN